MRFDVFPIPLDLWKRFENSIESLRQVEDEALPDEVKRALVESAGVTLQFVSDEVPVSGKPNPWRHRKKGHSVSAIKAYNEILELQSLLAENYSNLTDPRRRPEACSGLGYVAKQAIDNLVGSIAGLADYFVEYAGAPILGDGAPREAENVAQRLNKTETQKAPAVSSDDKTGREPRNKGGRPAKLDALWSLHNDMKKNDPEVTDKEIAAAYNKRFAAPIASGTRSKVSAKTVTNLRYDRTKRKR